MTNIGSGWQKLLTISSNDFPTRTAAWSSLIGFLPVGGGFFGAKLEFKADGSIDLYLNNTGSALSGAASISLPACLYNMAKGF